VVNLRRRLRVGLGDGGHPALQQAIRVHGNFIEYAPLSLVLILILELGQTSGWALHGLGAALFVGRLLHAQGLGSSPEESPGRFLGTTLTWMTLLTAALLCLLGFFGVRL
jgi:uncharacterized membrane protein YecN with MAPEG domain